MKKLFALLLVLCLLLPAATIAEAIGPEDLRQMACRLFAPEKLSSLVYL